MNQTTKKVTLALGYFSCCFDGRRGCQAGPALQSLNNMTNTAEFSVNNTYGQSFSVDGIIGAAVTPFATPAAVEVGDTFVAGTATITTGFTNSDGSGIGSFGAV